MAYPTPNLNSGDRFTDNVVGIFVIPVNVPCSIVAHGDFGGGTMTLTVYDPALDANFAVSGGSWTDDFEDGITGPFTHFILTMAGATNPNVAVTFGQITTQTHPR